MPRNMKIRRSIEKDVHTILAKKRNTVDMAGGINVKMMQIH